MFDGRIGEEGDLWLRNLTIARKHMLDTPVSSVVPGLSSWACGTMACFGGLLTTWQEFKDQGVYAYNGAPVTRELMESRTLGEYTFFDNLSKKLFGEAHMFDADVTCTTSAQAHAEVLRRLDAAIEARQVELLAVQS